ncbi:MAG: hypothetical protein CVU48_05710 [Candidatus Cloacimonetes bacterium HGW-Cloacimonetes-1]|jgi:signal transduction histidine kinase|nr:MAG: hypothetical protein CVU48_05710 [Candidatus Cloacimonetes bacterium HGW-Cloacimonetes-1]
MKFIGLIVSCGFDGSVNNIILNSLFPEADIMQVTHYLDVFNHASRDKAQSFFLSVIKDMRTADWELILELNDRYIACNFVGIKTSSDVIILAEADMDSFVDYLEDPTRLNSEMVNSIRSYYKQTSRDTMQISHDFYLKEMTQLNNELVNTQRELSKKKSDLEKLIEQKNFYVGMVAHDLRNPIGAIQAFSNILSDELGSTLNQDHRTFLDIINTTSDFMLTLVEDILQMSQLESGKIVLKKEPINLLAFLNENVQILQLIASRKQIDIQLNVYHTTEAVMMDRTKIQQVLGNLITNAIKFSPHNSSVWIETEESEEFVTILVRDEGPGIVGIDPEKLFEPFQIGKAIATDGESSTGLGLAIAKNIIKAHYGNLWVRSASGGGSVFSFSIPVTK